MFFREKMSPRSINPVLQLVENMYIDGKRKQKIIISLGTTTSINKEIRKNVAFAIKQKLLGQTSLWIDDQVKLIADNIVKKIQTEGKWDASRAQVMKHKSEDKETAEVFIEQVGHGFTRELGPLLIGHNFWKRLSIDEILSDCGFSGVAIKVAEISILNRLIAGDSENAIPSWIKVTAIADIIDKAAESFSKDRFYRVSDKLLENQEFIEKRLYERNCSVFNLSNAVYLYDLTNSYFEGACEQNPKAEYNKNQKEKRTDCPQIVVALVLDREGFVRRHFTYNGKMSDSKSLEKIITALKNDFDLSAMPTIIMDRGVACDENIALLESEQLKYIVASRSGEEKEMLEDFEIQEDFWTLKKDKTNEVKIKLKKKEGISYLLCKSSGRKKKETAMRNRIEENLIDALEGMKKLIAGGKRNSPEIVNQSIGRIKERFPKVAQYYEIQYTPFRFEYKVEKGIVLPKRLQNSLEIRKKKSDSFEINYLKLQSELKALKEKYPKVFENIKTEITPPELHWCTLEEKMQNNVSLDGNYLLKTNREDMDDAQIWNTYVMLTLVEKAFRDLKSFLGLRPNYHQLEGRVDGHIFGSILAYDLLHAIEYWLRQKGVHYSWATIKRVVSSHCYSTIILPTKSGAVLHIRKSGIPEAVHQEIYKLLNIDYDNLKTMKITA